MREVINTQVQIGGHLRGHFWGLFPPDGPLLLDAGGLAYGLLWDSGGQQVGWEVTGKKIEEETPARTPEDARTGRGSDGD